VVAAISFFLWLIPMRAIWHAKCLSPGEEKIAYGENAQL
jgi:hypothetical protein